MKFTTYRLDSAVEFDKKYASRSRLDVVSKTFSRIAQEVLLKQERTSASLILGTLQGNAATNLLSVNNATGNKVTLDDFNKLLTLAKRLNPSWAGGTPENRGRGISDLIVSPEIVESLRAMAYNPIASGSNTDIPATDSMRDSIYQNAGVPEFFGLGIMEAYEMGRGQRFNKIYEGLVNDAAVFADASQEIVIGLDRSKDALMRAVALDSDTGAQMTLVADDQYSVRQQRIGYYGALEEGRMILNDKAIVGMSVTM